MYCYNISLINSAKQFRNEWKKKWNLFYFWLNEVEGMVCCGLPLPSLNSWMNSNYGMFDYVFLARPPLIHSLSLHSLINQINSTLLSLPFFFFQSITPIKEEEKTTKPNNSTNSTNSKKKWRSAPNPPKKNWYELELVDKEEQTKKEKERQLKSLWNELVYWAVLVSFVGSLPWASGPSHNPTNSTQQQPPLSNKPTANSTLLLAFPATATKERVVELLKRESGLERLGLSSLLAGCRAQLSAPLTHQKTIPIQPPSLAPSLFNKQIKPIPPFSKKELELIWLCWLSWRCWLNFISLIIHFIHNQFNFNSINFTLIIFHS